MSNFNKILNHPNKNLIVSLLSKGVGVREVSKKIAELNPNNRKLHITSNTLQSFRKEKLNLDGEILEELKKAYDEREEIRIQKREDSHLRKIPAFREAVEKAVNIHVDIKQELQQLLTTIKLRIEDLYDKAVDGTLTVNEEANLQKYFSSWTNTIQQWAKYVDKIADRTIETNININVIEDQITVLRSAIRETIEEEMDPEIAVRFMSKLSQKMSELTYRQNSPSINTIYKETHKLVENNSEDDDEY